MATVGKDQMAKDKAGVSYTPPTSKPPTSGTRVTIRKPEGPVKGTYSGGYVTPDKKK